ncbi:acetate/propionate family kinase [Acidiphilium sp.]|uniref:acetate/propionate family kinase n=1 Tax=Acidiphilium sp. TaxID=527 RepID=UPI003D0054D5
MADAVLVLNAGSSSIKFALIEKSGARVAYGEIERIGEAPHFQGFDHDGAVLVDRHWADGAALSHEDLLGPLLDWAETHLGADRLIGVGHRIVHGGTDFSAPVRLDPTIMAALDRLTPLAPLHQPHNLAAIRAVTALRPDLPQIGCFDTGFHHAMPEVATRLPLPARYHAAGVRRYGFHGLSYEFIAARFAALDPAAAAGRVIAAHIGNGASACAMLGGRSIDTSMGFTALDGLMMGTRTGALDPGVVLYMIEQERRSAAEISHILYSESGLLGVSGLDADMRNLLASTSSDAVLAVDLFCYRAAREIAGLTVALGGVDALIFTAGIGEHAAPVRRMICDKLAHFGIGLDDAANQRHGPIISSRASRVAVWVIPTDEEAMIARHTVEMLRGEPA